MFAHEIRETEIRFVVLFPQGLWILKCIHRQCEIEYVEMPNTEHHLRYLKMCDVILGVVDKEVSMWNKNAFPSKYLENNWIFRLVMKLFIYSISLLSLVDLARSSCTENQYGKDGCEPEPFLCRHFTFDCCSCSFDKVLCLQDYLRKRCWLRARRKWPSDTNLRGICGQCHPSQRLRELCRGFVPSRLWNVRRRGRWHKAMQILAICKLDIINSTTYFLSQGPSGNYEDLLPYDRHSMYSVWSLFRSLPMWRPGVSWRHHPSTPRFVAENGLPVNWSIEVRIYFEIRARMLISPGLACAAPIQFKKNNIHWTCHNTGITGEIPNPYSPATTDLPPDTVCTSVSKYVPPFNFISTLCRRCADWDKQPGDPNLEKKLQVSCDGNEGKWVIDQEAGGEDAVYGDVILGEGADPIGEPPCTGGGVQLEIPEENIEDGSQLVCDTHLAPEQGLYKMGHPNTCILLCDYQLGMTINSGLNEEGLAVFKNQDGDEVTGSAVTCWGK